MTPSIAKVAGIARTSPAFRAGLYALADRHGWNVDAIAAVISSESGFDPAAKNPAPGQTAAGLLQWIDSTARNMFGISSATIASMSAEAQLPFVEKWFSRQLGDGLHRPVDFYLVGWGARAGLPDDYVLAAKGQEIYRLNAALDGDQSGQITVSDLRKKVEGVIASAGGERINASPLASSGATPSSGSRSSSALLVGVSTSLLRSCSDVTQLMTLRMGSKGPDVAYVRALLGLALSLDFDAGLFDAVKLFQQGRGLNPDGVIGPKTWGMLRKSVGGA